MDTVLRATRGLNRALHYVAGALIVVTMLLTVGNVLGRWLFARPIAGTVELTELAMLGIVYLGFAYAQHEDDHISVDLLYGRLGHTGRALVDAFASFVAAVVLALIAWRLWAYGGTLLASNRTTAARSISLYPFVYVAIVGAVAYLLAVLATTLERVRDDGGPSTSSPELLAAPAGDEVAGDDERGER
jgi:TRAP-type transport system small permease protein